MAESKPVSRFSVRSFTAVGSLFAGALLAGSGFLMDEAREMGLGKPQMANLHWFLAITFLGFALNHIRLNWRALVAHLRGRAQLPRPRLEWLAALVLVGLIGAVALVTAPAGRPDRAPDGFGQHQREFDD